MLVGMTGFLNVTTSEKKTASLLIEVFSKRFNTRNYGHLDQLRVAIYYLSGLVRITQISQLQALETMREEL